MASDHTPADDIVYDLVSIQYHALKAPRPTPRTATGPSGATSC